MELYELSAILWAIGVAGAAVLSLGGAFSNRLDTFTHFAPLYLVGGLVAIGLQLVRGRRRGRREVILGVAAVLISVGLTAPDVFARLTAQAASPGRQTLKVIQLNAWSKNVDPRGTAAWIARQNADVVVLEEVAGPAEDLPVLLRHDYPYRTPQPTSFDVMTVILSKAAPRDGGAWPSPDTLGRHSGAWASFGDADTGFTVVGAHALWPSPAGRQQTQTALLASRLQAFRRDNLILAGDFNSTPWSFSLRRQDALFGLIRRTHALFSWSVRPYSRYRFWTPVPLMPIDHVYAGAAWKTVSVTTGPKLGSDHLPIVAVLTR